MADGSHGEDEAAKTTRCMGHVDVINVTTIIIQNASCTPIRVPNSVPSPEYSPESQRRKVAMTSHVLWRKTK